MKSDKMKSHYDQQATGENLDEGEAVWLYNPQRKKGVSPKLSRPWQGPYIVMKKLNDLVYRIQQGPRKKPKVVHRNRLWTYSGRQPPTWHLPQTNLKEALAEANSREQTPMTMTGDSDLEETVDNVHAEETTHTSLRRSSRARRPPARYEPSY